MKRHPEKVLGGRLIGIFFQEGPPQYVGPERKGILANRDINLEIAFPKKRDIKGDMRQLAKNIIGALCAACAFCSVSYGAPEKIDLGVIERLEKGKLPPKPIYLVVNNAEAERWAKNAFRLHGGFELVSKAAEALFTVRLSVNGAAMGLTIESGAPAAVLFSETVKHGGAFASTMGALDLVVQKIWGIPGFFSGTLAFVGKKTGRTEVYMADMLFHNVSQLTQDRSDVVMPRFSPDGKKILYTTYFKSGCPDIFMMDLATHTRRSFATYRGTNSGAAYSPNGQAVAMVLSPSGITQVYVSGPDGKSPRRLTRDKGVKASPCWSPDGRSLLFTSDVAGRPQIFKLDVAGGTPKRIPTNISRYNAEPSWNPVKPNLFVFTAAVGHNFQVAIYDFETGTSEVITKGPGDCLEPVWLNDGRHVVFTKRSKSQTRIYIIDTLTQKEAPMHNDGFGDTAQAHFVYSRS